MVQAPAETGATISDIDTPALLLDLDAVDANLAAVHGLAGLHGVRVRAHAKAHKCTALARLQLKAGSNGLCCQKLSEAEVFAADGVDDILLTNEVVGAAKVKRAARLARSISLSVCADHTSQVEALAAAARAEGSRIGVYVEVDVGQGRCGVHSPQEVLQLVREISANRPYLGFEGLHAFNGKAQHQRASAMRKALVHDATAMVRSVRELLATEGFPCPTVTGGGTGTLRHDLASGAYTEVQPGSYVLMDADYARNECDGAEPMLHTALTVLCTVISRRGDQAVLDGGLKTFATDCGYPTVLRNGWVVSAMSDEHTVVIGQGDNREPLERGEKVQLQPSHCDPTVNLHNWLIATRGGRVEAVWPVDARGALL